MVFIVGLDHQQLGQSPLAMEDGQVLLSQETRDFLSLKFQPFGTFISRNISAEIFSVTLAYPYSQLEYKINKNAVTVRDSQKHNKKPNETK